MPANTLGNKNPFCSWMPDIFNSGVYVKAMKGYKIMAIRFHDPLTSPLGQKGTYGIEEKSGT